MTLDDGQVDETLVGQIVVTGNPIDGLAFYGPFLDDDGNAAGDWAAANLAGADWWIAPLYEADDSAGREVTA